MGKGGTRFVSEPIGVRAGRQRQTFSSRELEQDMVAFQETGVHPEIERAIQEHESSPRVKPLPEFNQNRPFIFLEFAIAKKPVGRITIELFNEQNPFGVELMLNRCRVGSQDSLVKTSVHKLLTEFAFFFGKMRGSQQLTPHPHLNHVDKGTVSISLDGGEIAMTLTNNMTGLDSTHQVLGRVHLGVDVLHQINEVISGPLDVPLDEITITSCGLTSHEGSMEASSSTKDNEEEGKSIEDSKRQLEEESRTTHSNLQSALVEGLHREQEQKRNKRKRNVLHYLSSSSSDSDD